MSTIKYWRVTIEPEYAIWETCRDNGVIAIGYSSNPEDFNVRRFKDEMNIGDKVIVYLKNKRVGGLGKIKGDYSVNQILLKGIEWLWRTRRLEWEHVSLYGWSSEELYDNLDEETKNALHGRDTVRELNLAQFEDIKNIILSW